MRHQILVIEDAADVRLIISSALSDCELHFAENLAAAKAAVAERIFDLYILDVLLPDGETLDLCRDLRKAEATAERPILFLSGRGSELDKLTAFAQGADDYITKPFSALELKARIQAKLRHQKKSAQATSMEFPFLRIDLEKRQVHLLDPAADPRVVKLTKIEFNLLVALCARPQAIKQRQTLLDEVWGQNISVTERSVDAHIYNLRKKLKPLENLIQADHGTGYYFEPNPLLKAS